MERVKKGGQRKKGSHSIPLPTNSLLKQVEKVVSRPHLVDKAAGIGNVQEKPCDDPTSRVRVQRRGRRLLILQLPTSAKNSFPMFHLTLLSGTGKTFSFYPVIPGPCPELLCSSLGSSFLNLALTNQLNSIKNQKRVISTPQLTT